MVDMNIRESLMNELDIANNVLNAGEHETAEGQFIALRGMALRLGDNKMAERARDGYNRAVEQGVTAK